MNDYFDQFASAGNTANDRKPGLFPSVYLPEGLYEALPAIYMSVGGLFVAGSVYLGVADAITAGYMAVGLSCILGGITVASIRRAERSK